MSTAGNASARARRRTAQPPPEHSRWRFLADLVVIRLINAYCLSTFFQPDEFFQSLEPAWRLAFGPDSHAWLTWEWREQLRSSLHPALFSAAYRLADSIAQLFPPGTALRTAVVLHAPQALQAVFAALGDWHAWQLAVAIYGRGTTSFTVLWLQVFSPWQWYVSTRTFSNSLETTLTVMALYHFPWSLVASTRRVSAGNKADPALPTASLRHLRAAFALAALAVILRPTNVLIWATVMLVTLSRCGLERASPLPWNTTLVLFREAFISGSLVLALSLASDYLYFGFWTFPPYRFLNFNVRQSFAVFYGRSPWHYYLVQGIPLLCTTSLPFVLGVLYKLMADGEDQVNVLRTLLYAVYVTVGALSLISHKEVRFIYPLLPILHILAAPAVASYFTARPSSTVARRPSSLPSLRHRRVLLAGLATNLILAAYLGHYHQSGPLDVLAFLRSEYERIHPASVRLSHTKHQAPSQDDEFFALFLMPCHSTPWRSHLVYPGLRAYALSCEPPLHTAPNTPERASYRDEADRFYDAPVDFLRNELFPPERRMPTPRYVVGFEGVEAALMQFVQLPDGTAALGRHPRRVWEGFNGLFHEDWRRAGKIVVWDTGAYEAVLGRGEERAKQSDVPKVSHTGEDGAPNMA